MKLDGLWSTAVTAAETPDLTGRALKAALTLPPACPLTLNDIVSGQASIEAREEQVRLSASTV